MKKKWAWVCRWLWACCLSLCLRSTTRILYNYDGVRETPPLLGEVSLEVQDNREDLSVTLSIPSSWWTNKHQLSIHKIHTHTATHTPTQTGANELWSRSLDNIVKQLHGLHDVLILERWQEDHYPFNCAFNCSDLLSFTKHSEMFM